MSDLLVMWPHSLATESDRNSAASFLELQRLINNDQLTLPMYLQFFRVILPDDIVWEDEDMIAYILNLVTFSLKKVPLTNVDDMMELANRFVITLKQEAYDNPQDLIREILDNLYTTQEWDKAEYEPLFSPPIRIVAPMEFMFNAQPSIHASFDSLVESMYTLDLKTRDAKFIMEAQSLSVDEIKIEHDSDVGNRLVNKRGITIPTDTFLALYGGIGICVNSRLNRSETESIIECFGNTNRFQLNTWGDYTILMMSWQDPEYAAKSKAIGGFAEHGCGESVNSEYVLITIDELNVIVVQAKRDINPDESIIIDYGSAMARVHPIHRISKLIEPKHVIAVARTYEEQKWTPASGSDWVACRCRECKYLRIPGTMLYNGQDFNVRMLMELAEMYKSALDLPTLRTKIAARADFRQYSLAGDARDDSTESRELVVFPRMAENFRQRYEALLRAEAVYEKGYGPYFRDPGEEEIMNVMYLPINLRNRGGDAPLDNPQAAFTREGEEEEKEWKDEKEPRKKKVRSPEEQDLYDLRKGRVIARSILKCEARKVRAFLMKYPHFTEEDVLKRLPPLPKEHAKKIVAAHDDNFRDKDSAEFD